MCDEFELLVAVSNVSALFMGGEGASNSVCMSLCTPASLLYLSLQLMWLARAVGVLTQYLLSLAGVLFNSRGVDVYNSTCIEPIVVQHVVLRGECSGCK